MYALGKLSFVVTNVNAVFCLLLKTWYFTIRSSCNCRVQRLTRTSTELFIFAQIFVYHSNLWK